MNAPADFMAPTDAASAQQWLARYSGLEPTLFLQRAQEILQAVLAQPRQALTQLGVMETVRAAIVDALRHQFAEHEFRTVPMTVHEAEVFSGALAVARTLRDAYAKLVDGATTDPVKVPDPQDRNASRDVLAAFGAQQRTISAKALAIQRVLATQSQIIVWCARARVSLADEDREVFMRHARLARVHEVADAPVFDPLMPDVLANTRACVSASVLMLLARPGAMAPIEFETMRDLARRHASKVKYKIETGEDATKSSPWPTMAEPGTAIRLDTRALSDEIKRLGAELDAGYSPESLGLDKRLSIASARDLVHRLYQAWRAPVSVAPGWRRPIGQAALAMPSWHAITSSLNKGEFDPSATQTQSIYQYRRREGESIVSREDPAVLKMRNLFRQAESWRIDGESASGFLFRREPMTPRVTLDQLVLVSTGVGQSRTAIFLGCIDAIAQTLPTSPTDGASQEIEVRLFMGQPILMGIKLDAGVYEDAFLLRTAAPGSTLSTFELQQIDTATASLILPLARWREGNVTEMIVDGAFQRVQLGKLIHRGQDFDQVGFKLL